jgi:hypothetical protein
VDNLGTLIIATPELCTASNPEHVAHLLQLQALLFKAGLLLPPTKPLQ